MGGKSRLENVLAQFRNSTLDKSRDLIALRRRVLNSMQNQLLTAGQAMAHSFAGRIIFALGNSGNSANILRAFEQAHSQGLLTIGLAGYDGWKMARLGAVNFSLEVPGDQVSRIQEPRPPFITLCGRWSFAA